MEGYMKGPIYLQGTGKMFKASHEHVVYEKQASKDKQTVDKLGSGKNNKGCKDKKLEKKEQTV